MNQNDYASLVIMLTLMVILVVEICLVIWLKRIRLKDKTQFRFCQFRRDIMRLVHEKKLPVNGLAFPFFYGLSSNIIHYIDDYKFDSYTFMKAVLTQPSYEALSQLENLISEVKQYDIEVKEVTNQFFKNILVSLAENCLLLKVLIPYTGIYLFFKRLLAFLGDRFKNIKVIQKLRYQVSLANNAKKWQEALSY